jgi:DNA uptake protein ComE-like DNA-binding protein
MIKIAKSILASASIALLLAGYVQAKDDPKVAQNMPAPAAPAASPSPKPAPASSAADKAKAAEPIDLNTASEQELATLPKIGEARAKAIVQGRPYKRKDELVDKKIIGKDVYNGIKDSVIAKQKPGDGKAGAGDGKK